MDIQKIDFFIITNAKYFPDDKIVYIREKLQTVNDDKWFMISSLQFKNPMSALLISIFGGMYGIDRFYLGHVGLGVGKLLTCGGLGIWTIIDYFLIMDAAKADNYTKLGAFLV